MTRTRVRHRCQACGATSPKWLGRCTECGEWGSLVEEAERIVAAAAGTAARVRADRAHPADAPRPIGDIDPLGAHRRPTGIGELDRVLGGGLVGGSVTLLGGEPGMGKSTLLLQALASLAASGARCLLVCGEESPEQVRLRAGRVGALHPDLLVVAETELPVLLAHARSVDPHVLAVDSIQTLHDPELPGAPGSVSQVREGAHALVQYAKQEGVATLLVGHVTKDGALAGPRVLEHVVDTVLSFEGDRHHALRLLRAAKHRFGATEELGVFEMSGDGLVGVPDASALMLTDRRSDACGSVVVPVIDGTRPVLVEVQALVSPTSTPVPRRSAQGLDANRLALLIAVLTQHAGCNFAASDVFVSAAGGVKVAEPGGDLGIALAMVAAQLGQVIPPDLVVVGEIGLGGELRQAPQTARRLAEAARLGFRGAIVPTSAPAVDGLALYRVATLAEAIAAAGLVTVRGPRRGGG